MCVQTQYYPGTTGFVYIIQAVDECLKKAADGGDCLELPELTAEELVRFTLILCSFNFNVVLLTQILIMEVVDTIRDKISDS
jgi:hypothetical protein